ncbi:hypothetical protein D3C72_1770630 [compost metagenome]
MAHMYHQVTFGPGRGKNSGGIVGGAIGAIQSPFAAWEVVILNVDDDQGVLAHFKSLYR